MPKLELTFVRTAIYVINTDKISMEEFMSLPIDERQKFLVEEDISLADARRI